MLRDSRVVRVFQSFQRFIVYRIIDDVGSKNQRSSLKTVFLLKIRPSSILKGETYDLVFLDLWRLEISLLRMPLKFKYLSYFHYKFFHKLLELSNCSFYPASSTSDDYDWSFRTPICLCYCIFINKSFLELCFL